MVHRPQPVTPSPHESYFDVLVNGLDVNRVAVIKELAGQPRAVRQALADKIISGLAGVYSPGGRDETLNPRSRSRSWLLSALARLLDLGPEVEQVFFQHLRAGQETNLWVRYWCLVSLRFVKHESLYQVAEELLQEPADSTSLLVHSLARTLLASRGDTERLQEVMSALNTESESDPDKTRAMLRALRVVNVPETTGVLCDVLQRTPTAKARSVGLPIFDDEPMDRSNYDAAVALSKIPPGYEVQYEAAGRALMAFTSENRGSNFRSGIRARTIRSLGHMGFRNAVGLLLEEMQHPENPSILQCSAQALEQILGTDIAVTRIVEFLLELHESATAAENFAKGIGYMRNRDTAVDTLSGMLGSSIDEKRALAQTLIQELGGSKAFHVLRSRTASVQRYEELMDRTESGVRTLFEHNLQIARRGFYISLGMDIMVFLTGIVLIVWAAHGAFSDAEAREWSLLASAGGGVAAIFYSLWIARPREQVSRAVHRLMRLQVIFLAFLRRLYQIDQAFVRRLIEDEYISQRELENFGQEIEHSMAAAMQPLDTNLSRDALTSVASDANAER